MLLWLGRLIDLPRNLYRWYRLPKIRVGDTYISCGNLAVLCTESTLSASSWLGPWDYDLVGVSLHDGETRSSCSASHCAPQKETWSVALLWAVTSPAKRDAVLQNMRRYI